MVKLSQLEEEIPLDKLTVNEPIDRAHFERLAWIDKQNETHEVPYPLTEDVLQDLNRQMTPQRASEGR